MGHLDDLPLFIIKGYDLQSLHLRNVILDLLMLSHLLHKEVVDHRDQLHVTRKHSRKDVNIPVH